MNSPTIPPDSTAAARGASSSDDEAESLLGELLRAGLLVSTGVDGLYGRNRVFEDLVDRLSNMIGNWDIGEEIELLRFPPAMSRTILEESGFLKSFPQLAGLVSSFCGDERAHQRLLRCLDRQEDWTESQTPTRLMMTPVACYPCYPVVAQRGPLPPQGRTLDIFSYCFRHEPSRDAERMQLFRQREYVRFGTPSQIHSFRETLIGFGERMADALQLPWSLAVANDPFFGRAGKIIADSQRSQQLKYELLIEGVNPSKPIACGSFNYHTDRFSKTWGIHTHDGELAHTGCCGFGLERLALCLFQRHGFDPARWPQSVHAVLWPGA